MDNNMEPEIITMEQEDRKPSASETDTQTEDLGQETGFFERRRENGIDPKTLKKINLFVPLIIALLSVFVMARYATSVSFHQKTIQALEEKKTTVMQLAAVSTGASAAITLIPGDVATPIADKLADLSTYFIIVLCAIYLEKYLLTITGFAAFVILIPLGSLLLSVYALMPRPAIMEVAKKLIFFGVAIVLVIPASVGVSDMIERTYSESITMTMEQAMQTTEDVTDSLAPGDESEAAAAVNEAGGTAAGSIVSGHSINAVDESSVSTIIPAEEFGETEGKNWFQDALSNATDTVTSTVQSAFDSTINEVETKIEEFKTMLNNMMEALAVMIVTSCLVPIIVLVFFIWLIKVILNVNVTVPAMGRIGSIGRRPV